MKKLLMIAIILVVGVSTAMSMVTAPRISDREIIEKLSELKAGQDATNKRLDDLRDSTNRRFDDMNKRFDDMNRRFDDVNKRLDFLQWMFGLFITVALFLIGIVVRLLWKMQGEQSRFKTSLETQKDELAFLKSLIEKLLPPKGVL